MFGKTQFYLIAKYECLQGRWGRGSKYENISSGEKKIILKLTAFKGKMTFIDINLSFYEGFD